LKIIAFDIETQLVPDGIEDLAMLEKSLDVYCIATAQWPPIEEPESGNYEIRLWHGGWGSVLSLESEVADSLNKGELSAFLHFLDERMTEGYIPVGFNSTHFDLQALAMSTGDWVLARKIAKGHYDMMLEMVARKGFGCKLQRAGEAIGSGKSLSGGVVEEYWALGDQETRQKVLDYVRSDAVLTADVAMKAMQSGSFKWITSKGNVANWELDSADGEFTFLTVEEIMKLRDPDTSWMDKPPMFTKESLAAWVFDEGSVWTSRNSYEDDDGINIGDLVDKSGALIDYGMAVEPNDEWDCVFIRRRDGQYGYINITGYRDPGFVPLGELWARGRQMEIAEASMALEITFRELFDPAARRVEQETEPINPEDL